MISFRLLHTVQQPVFSKILPKVLCDITTKPELISVIFPIDFYSPLCYN